MIIRPGARRLGMLGVAVAIATASLTLPVTPTHASCVPTPDNHDCPPPNVADPSEFNVLVPTPDPGASYYAVYSLAPIGWTSSVGTVLFYMGPTGDSATEALELAAASAPDTIKNDVLRAENMYLNGEITTPTVGTNVQMTGAQPMCGNHNSICQRYEEMKYCEYGNETQSGDGACNDASRTVDGVFSYDNNGAYASDTNDFVDCSQNTQTSSQVGNDTYRDYTTVSWCGYWNQGPWSSNVNTTYMDYGMNIDVYSNTTANPYHYSAWIRMDDYAGCGSVGNRGGSNR